jgi:hypothetical protein
MFGPRGNPQARNLFSVIGYLQKRARSARASPNAKCSMRHVPFCRSPSVL